MFYALALCCGVVLKFLVILALEDVALCDILVMLDCLWNIMSRWYKCIDLWCLFSTVLCCHVEGSCDTDWRRYGFMWHLSYARSVWWVSCQGYILTLSPLVVNFEDRWWPMQTILIQMKPHKTWGFIWDPNCSTFRLYIYQQNILEETMIFCIFWKKKIFEKITQHAKS